MNTDFLLIQIQYCHESIAIIPLSSKKVNLDSFPLSSALLYVFRARLKRGGPYRNDESPVLKETWISTSSCRTQGSCGSRNRGAKLPRRVGEGAIFRLYSISSGWSINRSMAALASALKGLKGLLQKPQSTPRRVQPYFMALKIPIFTVSSTRLLMACCQR